MLFISFLFLDVDVDDDIHHLLLFGGQVNFLYDGIVARELDVFQVECGVAAGSALIAKDGYDSLRSCDLDIWVELGSPITGEQLKHIVASYEYASMEIDDSKARFKSGGSLKGCRDLTTRRAGHRQAFQVRHPGSAACIERRHSMNPRTAR